MSKILPAISALGTQWLIEIFDEVSPEKTDEAFGLIRLFLSDFEAKYSRFKPDSIISTVNRTKVLYRPDPTTISLLNFGKEMYKETGGIFNLLIGGYLMARGYDSDYSFAPKAEPTILPSPLSDLSINSESITLQAGLIDLGGYGKGFIIDRLADYLKVLGFDYFLINGGGDMYATSDYGKPVTIYLEHPINTDTYIKETTIMNQGFAASSTHKRRWKVAGQEYSHIVDTKKNVAPTIEVDGGFAQIDHNPDTLGIYTKAPTAVLADVWSTTLLISDVMNHTVALEKAQIAYAYFNTNDNTLTQSQFFSCK